MVQRVHKYADGGKIVKDHLAEPKVPRNPKQPSPGFTGAIKDFIGSLTGATKVGETVDAKKRKSRIDQAIDDAGG